MLVLLASLSLAANPNLACEALSVEIPEVDADADARPKGFWWEGWSTTAVLEDGRILVARLSALERLSRGALKKQHAIGKRNDRIMQLAVLTPDGSLESSATLERGTLLEALALPGGGVVVARTSESITAIDHLDKRGSHTGTVFLRGDPQADKIWRHYNPLQATGPSRLTPVGPTRIAAWHAGIATAFDLETHEPVARVNLWPLGVFVLRGRRLAKHELFVADQSRQLRWMDADLKTLRTRMCEGCRVVGLDKTVPFDKAEGSWLPAVRQRSASVASVDDEHIRIEFAGLSTRDKDVPAIEFPVPQGEVGRDWTWRFREGPWGSALLAISTSAGAHTVSAVQPGVPEPVWSWTAPPDLLKSGEDLVVDAMGPYVRLRVVSGQALEEKTRLAALADPRTGQQSDFSAPTDAAKPLSEALSSPWVSRHYAGDVLLRQSGDPMMERQEPGPSQATFERCRIELAE